ncbi:hypothetical protein F4778DRAFT_784592 [Xylariomycetidae sp. FL2044]|nr:hypothetical protein F4778DRAFT_784592 [Xylariomycetidae sp. FL2044]
MHDRTPEEFPDQLVDEYPLEFDDDRDFDNKPDDQHGDPLLDGLDAEALNFSVEFVGDSWHFWFPPASIDLPTKNGNEDNGAIFTYRVGDHESFKGLLEMKSLVISASANLRRPLTLLACNSNVRLGESGWPVSSTLAHVHRTSDELGNHGNSTKQSPNS